MISRTIYLFWPTLQMLLGLWLAYRYWDRIGVKTCIVYYLMRMAFLFTAWPLIGKVPVDIQVWAVHASWLVDDGLLPVIDFPTAYHLGFNFLLWLSYSLFHSPYSIMLIFHCFEIASIPFLYLAFKNVYDEKTAKRVVIIVISAPICWYCAIYGQDEPIVMFFSSLLLLALANGKTILAAFFAFLCFSATKVLVPIYLWANMVVSKGKGLLLLVGAMTAYWAFALLLGVNPFDFRSGTTLDSPGFDLSAAGYVRGSVWYYLRSIPKPLHFVALMGSWGLSALAFLKAFLDAGLEYQKRLQLSCVLVTIVGLEFFAFYRVCYYPYMLPFIPCAVSAMCNLDLQPKWRRFVIVTFVLWLWFLPFKEGANCWVSAMGYGVDAILYFGYCFFSAVLFYGSRKHITSPWTGFKSIPEFFKP